ncbi:hypothetical protein AAFC00_000652 [Neodothiora populina]
MRDLFLGWLANPVKSYEQRENEGTEEATWLLIFDNVDNLDDLDDYWPADGSGSVLVTSRDPLSKTYLFSRSGGKDLSALDITDATKLLTKLVGRKKQTAIDRNDAKAVAGVLGGYPLAITQMAGVIARRDLTFAEFLDLYIKDSAREDLFTHTGPARARAGYGYEFTVASVWALEDLKYGGTLLDVVSMLGPDGIPEYILEPDAVLPGYPQDSSDYLAARTELIRSSLITRDKNSEKVVVHTHRLLQDRARARMSSERFDFIFTLSLNLLSSAWPYEEFSFGNELYRWGRCEELYPHVRRLQSLSSRFTPPSELSWSHIQGPKLLLDAAWSSIMRANYTETPPMLQLAGKMLDRLHEQQVDSPDIENEILNELQTLRRLIFYYRGARTMHTNEPDVTLANLEVFKNQVIAEYGEKISGGTDRILGVAWNEYGNALLQNNDTVQAIDCYWKSIDALASLDNATGTATSMPLVNLGFAYWIQGNLLEAEHIFTRALQDRETAYGTDDRTSFVTGKLLLGLGNVKLAQKDFDRAYALHRRSLQQYKATVGPNHHRTGDACRKVAEHCLRLDDLDSSSKFLDQSAKIYGDHHHFISERACTHRKRGLLERRRGNDVRARENFDAAMKLYKQLCPDDPRTIDDLSDDDFDKKIMFWSR